MLHPKHALNETKLRMKLRTEFADYFTANCQTCSKYRALYTTQITVTEVFRDPSADAVWAIHVHSQLFILIGLLDTFPPRWQLFGFFLAHRNRSALLAVNNVIENLIHVFQSVALCFRYKKSSVKGHYNAKYSENLRESKSYLDSTDDVQREPLTR